jgi:signal peptidase II
MNSDPFVIIPKVLNFQYHENNGAVWGILSGKVDFLKIFTIIILAVILFLYFKIPEGKKYNALKILAVFIVAGAVGNLIDRFYLGYVVDFIYFEIIDFPLFNFADSCLTVSSILLFVFALFYYKDEDFAFLDSAFRKKKNESITTEANEDSEDDDNDDED